MNQVQLETYLANATGHPVDVRTGVVFDKPVAIRQVRLAASDSVNVDLHDGFDALAPKVLSLEANGRTTNGRGYKPDKLYIKTAMWFVIVGAACDVFVYGE